MGISKLSSLIAVARVNFLTLTLACLFLAIAYAWQIAGTPNRFLALLVSIAALSAHVSVNAFNEYFDFRSGLDFLTPKTSFSGGSGALIQKPNHAKLALALAIISLVTVIVMGVLVIANKGLALLWLGIPGIVLIYTYTHYINRFAFLCLIAPGVGFGLIMTMGAIWVLSAEITINAVFISAIVMLLVNNLLLLNQYPDCEADAQAGRQHYPIVIGRKHSAWIFTGQWLAAYLLLVTAVLFNGLPMASLLTLLLLPLMLKLIWGVHKYANSIDKIIPFLGLNIVLIHSFLLLFALGIIIS